MLSKSLPSIQQPNVQQPQQPLQQPNGQQQPRSFQIRDLFEGLNAEERKEVELFAQTLRALPVHQMLEQFQQLEDEILLLAQFEAEETHKMVEYEILPN
jgi:hypothetical protein